MKKQGRCNDRDLFIKIFNESNSISEMGRKLGYKTKRGCVPGGVSKIIRQKIEEYGLNIEKLKGQGWSKGFTKYNNETVDRIARKKILPWNECFKDGSRIHNQSLIKRLVGEGRKKYACEECGTSTWLGKNIVLELHHLNEKFNDNREENLKILCPNCHSLFKKGEYSWTFNDRFIQLTKPRHL